MKKYVIVTLAFATALASCTQIKKTNSNTATVTNDPLRVLMDTTVKPSDDFIKYASGAWFKANPIPPSRSTNGIFQMVQDSVNKAVREICEKSAAMKNPAPGSAEQKIGDFFASGMDTVKIEQQKLQPIQPLLDEINAIKTKDDVLRVANDLRRDGVSTMFSFYVTRDDKISSKYSVFVSQGGLGLPDRDYYTNTDGGSKAIRAEYLKHLARIYHIGGMDTTTATKTANKNMQLETELAKASRKLEDLRDPYKNYNKMAVPALMKVTPDIPWNAMAANMGFQSFDSIIVGQPEFIKQLNVMVKQRPVDNWKNYFTAHVLDEFGPYLHKELDNTVYDFYLAKLNGVKQQKPRWERVVEQTDRSLGELIGQIYVRDYLPKGTKEKMQEIGNNIMAVYKEHIQKLDWMSDSTKQKALVKLSKVNMKLGWPDKWKDMSSLTIDRSSYAGNVMRANQWEYDYMVHKYGKPIDPNEWDMTPQTYNAYYNPTGNEIVIPGCNIIVPGFKGLPDDAVLYAVVGGSTYGHEITHGFDDQGRLYDEKGNLHNWWSKEDSARFTAKAQALVNQFNTYTVNDSLHVRGQASLGENIADLGGVVMGLEAFKKTKTYQSGEKIGGMTPEQRYFLGYAYGWMVNVRPEAAAKRLMSDVHSPPQYRVIGPLTNIPEYYKAFNLTSGAKYYRDSTQRVIIW